MIDNNKSRRGDLIDTCCAAHTHVQSYVPALYSLSRMAFASSLLYRTYSSYVRSHTHTRIQIETRVDKYFCKIGG